MDQRYFGAQNLFGPKISYGTKIFLGSVQTLYHSNHQNDYTLITDYTGEGGWRESSLYKKGKGQLKQVKLTQSILICVTKIHMRTD